jgi:Tol biopolymer transport system component/predicted Ser/Thr protein kinase
MIGQTVSHYRVIEKLGGGGMGIVYKAEDTRLHRDVALKFLPDTHFDDPSARERFEREAHSASVLNHPHICTVYDIGEHEGQPFIVMECLQGQTLKHRIGTGRFTIDEILDVGLQVADALDVAHGRGIVHRDIKPANIFITTRGQAKVLDFGLAMLSAKGAGSDGQTATIEMDLTSPGTALGTVAYMSPAQALGKPLDLRTDLFSLGVVLYEVATGTLPFRGESTAAIFDAILNKAPTSALRSNPELPIDLDRIISKCLEKDPDLRYQSSRELMADLKRLRRDTGSGQSAAHPTVAQPAPARPRSALWVGLAAGALVLATVLGVWALKRRAPQAPIGPITITPFTTDGGGKFSPRLSPDGEKVAYAWAGPNDDNWDVYVKALGPGTRALRITEDPAHDWSPTWSSDGRQIAFVRMAADNTSAIYTVPALGGQERKLVDVVGPATATVYFLSSLSWSPDGEWLAFVEKAAENAPARIMRLTLATLDKRPLTTPPPESLGDLEPQISPDGKLLAFVRSGTRVFGNQDVWVQPVSGGEARRLTSGQYQFGSALNWTTDGAEIVFSDGRPDLGGRIARVPVTGGALQPVAGVGENAVHASVRGNRMVYVQSTPSVYDTWRLARPEASRAAPVPEKFLTSSKNAAYAPDGSRIAFESDRGGTLSLWLCNADGSHPVQLTTTKGDSGTARWSPDGRRLVFDSLAAGNWDLYVVGADGGTARRLTAEPSEDGTGSWSRDGRWIYFHSDRTGRSEVWKIPPDGGTAVQVTRGGGFYAVESADGRDLYYTKSSASGIWRVPTAGGTESEVVAGPVGWEDWALARHGLYYWTAKDQLPLRRQVMTIHYLDFASGRATPLFRKEGVLNHLSLAVSPDEKWLLYGEVPGWQSELMLMENFR